jgi:AcrR family transcriptional regulator
MPTKATPRARDKTRDTDPNGRQRLLTVSMTLFAEKGFDGVTVRDIARAADVSVGLLNHHFGSKEGLRQAVDNHVIQQFEEIITDNTAPGASGEALYNWLEGWIGRHSAEWETTVAYMRRALLEDSDWGGQLFQRFFQIARTSIDRMDANGTIRPEVDRLWLPFLFVYLELGTLLLAPHIQRVLGKSGFDRDLWRRRYKAYLDLITRGVTPPDKLDELLQQRDTYS